MHPVTRVFIASVINLGGELPQPTGHSCVGATSTSSAASLHSSVATARFCSLVPKDPCSQLEKGNPIPRELEKPQNPNHPMDTTGTRTTPA